MTAGRADTVVIALGNTFRRDDGVGPAVAAVLDELALPNVVVQSGISDPMALVEAWSGAGLAIVVDAVAADPSASGRVRRCTLDDLVGPGLSSHTVDVVAAHELGRALGRAPGEVVVVTVGVADTGHGVGLSPRVSAAVPEAVGLALAEIRRADDKRPSRVRGPAD